MTADHPDLFAAALEIRREVMGAEYVERALAATSSDNEAFQRLVTEVAWGQWVDPALSRRERSLITLDHGGTRAHGGVRAACPRRGPQRGERGRAGRWSGTRRDGVAGSDRRAPCHGGGAERDDGRSLTLDGRAGPATCPVRRPVRSGLMSIRRRVARPALASRLDVVVVGGGIVGLATAYRLLTTRPGLRVEVLEAAGDVGTEQSGRNSGVAHAGLYYMPGSDRARWCREGKAALEEYCAERGIPYERRGKLVVAVRADELPRLGGSPAVPGQTV